MQRRRDKRQTRARIAQIETLLARASAHLCEGQPLAAQRAARTAEQLAAINARLDRRVQAHSADRERLAAIEHTLQTRERDLGERHAALNQRELDLAVEEERLAELRASLEALYAEMYRKGADPPDASPSSC